VALWLLTFVVGRRAYVLGEQWFASVYH